MNTSHIHCHSRTKPLGISLFEMLLAVSILGIMAAVALPSFGQQRDVFADIKDKRNAQEMVAEVTIATAAGVDGFVGPTVNETIERLLKGATVSEGAFAGRKFGLKQMSEGDAHAAARYLTVANDQLRIR